MQSACQHQTDETACTLPRPREDDVSRILPHSTQKIFSACEAKTTQATSQTGFRPIWTFDNHAVSQRMSHDINCKAIIDTNKL